MGIINLEAKSFSTICHILKHCSNATSKGRGRKGTLGPKKPTKKETDKKSQSVELKNNIQGSWERHPPQKHNMVHHSAMNKMREENDANEVH